MGASSTLAAEHAPPARRQRRRLFSQDIYRAASGLAVGLRRRRPHLSRQDRVLLERTIALIICASLCVIAVRFGT